MNEKDRLLIEDSKISWRENARAQVAEEIKRGQLSPDKATERENEIYAALEQIGMENIK